MSNSSKPIFTMVEKVTSFAEIRECSASGKKSVHASMSLMQEQILSKFEAKEILTSPNYLTVQIGYAQHIMLNPEWLQYINHSCDPNVFFDVTKQEVIVLHPIESGEEITFFYPSTEWSMTQTFNCWCGSRNCLGKIRGAAYLPPEVVLNYNLSKFIQQKLHTSSDPKTTC